jgi:peptidoglycan/xylan/chitin deacetylase (PgdA/CDA1 family)
MMSGRRLLGLARRRLARILGRGAVEAGRPLILLYHRVADVESDPWGLAVSPRNFRDQMRVLSSRGLAVSLDELVQALTAGRLRPGTVCVTFDDGYSDNLLNAKPILEECSVPATFFLTSSNLQGNRNFWWDALEGPFFRTRRLPPTLDLRVGDVALRLELGDDAELREAAFVGHRRWRAWDPAPSRRHLAYRELWETLAELPYSARETLVDTIHAWAGDGDATPECRPLSSREVRQLGSGSLIEVGGHSVTHPSLPLLEREDQAREILENKTRLEELVGRPLRHFSYPHGRFGEETVSLVKAAGYRSACTSATAAVTRAADVFRLPRISVRDWTGAEFSRELGLQDGRGGDRGP